MGLVYAGGQLVIGTATSQRIYTIADINNPSPVNRGSLPISIAGLTHDGTRFLASDSAKQIYEFNPTNPSAATSITALSLPGVARAITWDGRLVVLTTDPSGFSQLHTVTNLSNPSPVDQGDLPTGLGELQGAVWATF